MSRHLVVFIVVPLLLAGLFGASAATPHDHHDHEPGLYNPGCGILALAALGSTAALPQNGPTAVITAVVGELPAFAPVVPPRRSTGPASSRAPPCV